MKTWRFVVIVVSLSVGILCIPGCKGEEAGSQVGHGSIGDLCSSNSDCPGDSECIPLTAESICTFGCHGDSDCQDDFPGGCCEKIGTGFYCHPAESERCESPDTDGDGEEEESGPCAPDTYRCGDVQTVERCNSAGEWVFYKPCQGDTFCFDGTCMRGGDGEDCANWTGEGCCPNSYRCRGLREVQRCRDTDGAWDWEYYRDCTDDMTCLDGECIKIGDDIDGDVVENDEEIELGEPCTIGESCENPDEYCFSDEYGATEGYCKPFCDLGVPEGRCPRGYHCNYGQCEWIEGYCRSDAQCNMDEFCNKIPPGAEDGLCYPYCNVWGQYCQTGYYCDENENSINYGKCVPEDNECHVCSYDGQCDVGQYCNIWPGLMEGCCVDMCGPDNPCRGSGVVCDQDGRCVPGTPLPDCGGPCPAGYKCVAMFGQCVLDCPPCPENQFCDASTAPNCVAGPCTNPPFCGFLLKQCCFGYQCSAIIYGVYGFCI